MLTYLGRLKGNETDRTISNIDFFSVTTSIIHSLYTTVCEKSLDEH